jgi:hypothetical protein
MALTVASFHCGSGFSLTTMPEHPTEVGPTANAKQIDAIQCLAFSSYAVGATLLTMVYLLLIAACHAVLVNQNDAPALEM